MKPRVSVVIPTWNGKALVEACLRTLDAQTMRADEIIVVDDGSTDGTPNLVRDSFPAVALIELPRNRGFCAAVNAGIRASTCDLVLLLNNDMTLDRDFLRHLTAAAAAPDAELFAPLVLFRDSPDTIYGIGDRQRADGRPESIGFRCPRKGFHYPETIFGVSAGAGLYKRQVFERVGLFDERFVAYFEDSDLNFRARLAGFKARAVPEAVAYHVGSASLGGRHLWRTRQCFRNHGLLVLKNFPAALLVRHAPAIAAERIHQAGRVLSEARSEYGLARAIGELMSIGFALAAALPHALRERIRIQRGRAISIDRLDALLDTDRDGI